MLPLPSSVMSLPGACLSFLISSPISSFTILVLFHSAFSSVLEKTILSASFILPATMVVLDCSRCRPVTRHHLVRHASKKKRVPGLEHLGSIFILFRPMPVPVDIFMGPLEVAVERYEIEDAYFSHTGLPCFDALRARNATLS